MTVVINTPELTKDGGEQWQRSIHFRRSFANAAAFTNLKGHL